MKYSIDPRGLYELEILKYTLGLEDGFVTCISTRKRY